NELGQVYYYDSVRVNLGLFQHDVSVIWDLAGHDLSIMDLVLTQRPRAVSATGMSHVPGSPENIAYLTLFFDDSLIAHIHLNWLAHVQGRQRPPRQTRGVRPWKGGPHAGGRQPEDDRLRRPRAQREDQALRQGHHA